RGRMAEEVALERLAGVGEAMHLPARNGSVSSHGGSLRQDRMLAEVGAKRQRHGTDERRQPLHVPGFPRERQWMARAPVPHGWTPRRALGWAIIPLFGFALAFWLRYGVIQPEAI